MAHRRAVVRALSLKRAMKPAEPLLSDSDIALLLTGHSISSQHPWDSDDESTIDNYLKYITHDLQRRAAVEARIEWGHYGSGYASYVDAWFYRPTPDFDAGPAPRDGAAYTGLVVLFSRLAPWFVLMEGQKSWSAKGSSSYLPYFQQVDGLKTPAVVQLAAKVQALLEEHGLVRLRQAELDVPLSTTLRVPTVLADAGYTHFDAIFHWED